MNTNEIHALGPAEGVRLQGLHQLYQAMSYGGHPGAGRQSQYQ